MVNSSHNLAAYPVRCVTLLGFAEMEYIEIRTVRMEDLTGRRFLRTTNGSPLSIVIKKDIDVGGRDDCLIGAIGQWSVAVRQAPLSCFLF